MKHPVYVCSVFDVKLSKTLNFRNFVSCFCFYFNFLFALFEAILTISKTSHVLNLSDCFYIYYRLYQTLFIRIYEVVFKQNDKRNVWNTILDTQYKSKKINENVLIYNSMEMLYFALRRALRIVESDTTNSYNNNNNERTITMDSCDFLFRLTLWTERNMRNSSVTSQILL